MSKVEWIYNFEKTSSSTDQEKTTDNKNIKLAAIPSSISIDSSSSLKQQHQERIREERQVYSVVWRKEIEEMKNKAKENAAEDKKKKEAVDVRNGADNLVFQTKKQIEELKEKIPADAKAKLEAEIVKVEEALKTDIFLNPSTQ